MARRVARCPDSLRDHRFQNTNRLALSSLPSCGCENFPTRSENMAQKNEASRSPVTPQLSSHGRGGAGNMVDSSQSSKLHPSDLETPLLKNPVVTTGRGGTGNMAKNADPRETRRRQDVGA